MVCGVPKNMPECVPPAFRLRMIHPSLGERYARSSPGVAMIMSRDLAAALVSLSLTREKYGYP